MLPTFVIGLREGLEAALIVGIIAAFLRKQGRRDLLRWMFAGVGIAVALCVAVGVALEVLSRNLPQRQQEGLETVIGALAVIMVTYMVVWMRRNSRGLKGQLEGMADAAMQGHSRAGRAMVAMAFLAVLREGFETVVFLTATFNEAANTTTAAGGALIGILVAVALGYGIYRGGVRINLSKFFRATGAVLVLVAAGLVVNALRTAHEAGWLDAGQARTLDLTWLVNPGSVQSSLLTGMLGIQAHPVLIELIGWLVYLVPVGAYVVWPPGKGLPPRVSARLCLAAGAAAGLATLAVVATLPGTAPERPITSAAGVTAQVIGRDGAQAVIRTEVRSPAAHDVGAAREITVRHTDAAEHAGVAADVYTASVRGSAAGSLPRAVSVQRVAELNGGRLPIGLRVDPSASVAARYADTATLTAWVEPRTGRVIDLRWAEHVTAAVDAGHAGWLALTDPVAAGQWSLSGPAAHDAAALAAADLDRLDRRSTWTAAAWACGLGALALLVAGGAFALRERAAGTRARHVTDPTAELV